VILTSRLIMKLLVAEGCDGCLVLHWLPDCHADAARSSRITVHVLDEYIATRQSYEGRGVNFGTATI